MSREPTRCGNGRRAGLLLLGAALAVSVRGAGADGEFVEFSAADRAIWIGGCPGPRIRFDDLIEDEVVTDQYLDRGVRFGGDVNQIERRSQYVTDGWGLDGRSVVELTFDPPIRAVLFDGPGANAVECYAGGRLVHERRGMGLAWGICFRRHRIDHIRYFDPDGVPQLGNATIDNLLFATELPDCDGDGEADVFEIIDGRAADCNGNAIPDACDIASGTADDCNGNGVPDSCEVVPEFRAETNTTFSHVGGTDFHRTLGSVPEAAEAAGPIRLWVWARGDIDAPNEFGLVFLNETIFAGYAWTEPGPGCLMPTWEEFPIDPAAFNETLRATGGEASVRIAFSGAIDSNECNHDLIQAGVIYGAAMPNDQDANGIPDDCQCPADVDRDGAVGFSDLLALLAAWGECEKCPEDLDHDGDVGFTDLLALLAAWGACD